MQRQIGEPGQMLPQEAAEGRWLYTAPRAKCDKRIDGGSPIRVRGACCCIQQGWARALQDTLGRNQESDPALAGGRRQRNTDRHQVSVVRLAAASNDYRPSSIRP